MADAARGAATKGVKALAPLDPTGCGLDGASAQLEARIYVMADEARPHFCVDPAHRQSYREDLVGAIAHPSAVPPDAERCSQRSQSKALSLFNNQSIDRAHFSCDQRVRLQVTRLRCRRHATSTLIVIGAPA